MLTSDTFSWASLARLEKFARLVNRSEMPMAASTPLSLWSPVMEAFGMYRCTQLHGTGRWTQSQGHWDSSCPHPLTLMYSWTQGRGWAGGSPQTASSSG